MKKVIRIVLGTLFSLAILACDIGLGEIVDIDAPEITLSKMVSGTAGVEETEANTKRNFDGTIFTKQEVSFYGEASDNVGVTRVHVEIKWLEDTDYVFFKDATISGNAWSVNLLFPKEGACWLKFIVSDRAGNFGSMSSRVIALYVDNDAPIGDAWYIDRLINGIQYNFKSYASLYKLVEEDDPKLLNPTNKDVAQNGTFNVCGTLTDSIGVADGMTLTLEPYNPADPKISGIGISSETSSNYAPKFKISPEMDINGISCKLPESGKHYYQIKYSASDLVTDPAPNVVTDAEVSAGWFLWWPESDVPKCYISNADADTDEIKIYTSDSLNITIFDDDALSGEVKCELKKGADIISSKTETISGSTTRETNIIMQAPDRPQILTLSVSAKDINGKELNKVYSVFVTDDFTPTLILTSPENNQIPSVTGNDADINFTGITLDKAGCKYLEFVWVPDSVKTNVTEKNALAVAWLDQIAGEGKHELYVPAGENKVKVTSGTDAFAGCKLWSAKLTDAGFENSFIKHTFSFNISALNDFADDKTKEKNFIARVTREDGNYSDTELKLAADNLVPEIQIINPTGNMGIIDQDVDLVIKFSAKKSSGIQIKECRLSYVSPDNAETPLTISESNGIYTSEVISKSTLANYFSSNINPKYRIYAEDVLGNKNTVTYQFIISSLPQIKTVTSSASEKCKKDDVISINVSFSKVVTIPDGDVPVLRLTNIKNTTTGLTEGQEIEGIYKEGSGTTTLIFEYKVKEGDISQGLQVYNEAGVGPIKGLNKNSTYVHLATLTDENNLQAKRSVNPIKIDGVLPKISSVSFSSADAASENKKEGTTYLKAGRTITAVVMTDKKVTVQGSPVFTLVSDADSSKKINLSFKTVSSDGKTITFEGKIADTDGNGKYSYDADGYLSDASIFKDEYGNALVVPAVSGNKPTEFFIDTKKPKKPVIKNSSGTANLASGKYKDSVSFTISRETSDTTTYTEYSEDAGRSWTSYTGGAVTVTNSASIVARTTDYAGNVSDYSDVIDLDLNSSFPAFTVECTNPDGNFKCGTVLEFKVSFANAVNIAANAGAYIQLSDNNTTDKFTGKAYLKDKTAKSGVTEAVFTYTTQNKDDFTLKIAQAGVVLTGFTDQYGVGQGNKSLTADYTRPSLHCDSVAPYVVTMVPGGTPTTQNNLKAYSGAKTITLTFSENVSAVSGNIYLRQTNGWAIPPMFTADEFNKVLNAAKSAAIDPSKTNSLTASQVLYMDGLEDAESLYGSTTGPANDRYHGTAQYAGPYKKMTNGVNNSGNPDLSVKYVLDFSLDIWDSNKAMLTKYVGNEGESVNEPRFGKTYEDHDNTNVLRYHHLSRAGLVKVLTPGNTITTDSIRYVLEQAHFHERYMAVDSSYVIVSGNTVTLNFPDGLLGDSDLPLGREWELVIEEGAFMDETGNQFGYEYSGNALAPTTGNRIQIANKGTTEGIWGRRNESTGTPVVLIQDGNNVAFMSAGVAKPVIRVDRYSYGLGIKQPVLQRGQQLWTPLSGDIVYQKIDSIGNNGTPNLQTGSTVPTGIVGVRIDTESKGAKIRFSYSNDVKKKNNVSSSRNDGGATNTYSVSSKDLPSNPSTSSDSYSGGIVFLAGSGLLTEKNSDNGQSLFQSCKQYIKADALYSDSVTSSVAQEGIFQTIVNISSPAHNGRGNTIYNAGQGRQVLNIHGTTGLSGEPTIAPFPLRDQPVGSAYMRQTYQDEDQYYWLSYEVLVDAGYSMYVFGQYAYQGGGGNQYNVDGYKNGWGDWAQNYGLMAFGEFNVCTGMESWPGKSTYTDDNVVPDNGNAD